MTKILQINSAARSQGAQSTLLATELVEKLRLKHNAEVTVRDLLKDGTPHLDDDTLGAFFTPADKRSGAQQQINARSEALIAELQAADIVVLGVPMYNFGISSQLKTYFDWIARVGVTFRYTPEGRPEGLVRGKKVYVVAARGGKYAGTPNDTQTPYLQTFLGFLGMSDVEFIYAEGMAMGEAAADAARAAARAAIAAI